jgi:hypothetical protein
LAALHQPVPRPTKAAVKQNEAEIASRKESTTIQRLMGVIKKGPDVAQAARVGEPTLVPPTPIAARDVIQGEARAMMDMGKTGNSLTIVKTDQPAPGSDTAAPPSSDSPFGQPAGANAPPTTPDPNELKPDPNELKPNAPADPNELKPSDNGGDQALPPPPQVNEIQQGQSSSTATASADSTPASDQEISSSKKKKKKGMKKIVPF